MQRTAPFLLTAVILAGCSANDGPVLAGLADQRAYVNVELQMVVSAVDADDDPMTFSFSAADGVGLNAFIETNGDGRAVFHWTPLISDVGRHKLNFSVSDGESTTSEMIGVDVTHQSEGANAPHFIQPLGTGTTIDVTKYECLEIPIVVDDPDTPGVRLDHEEPLILGAEIFQGAELSGLWWFCPSKEQIATEDRLTLTLSADDFDNPKTLKEYLIVIRSGDGAGCPGEPPAIVHTADDISGVNDLSIVATVSDELGMKYAPLLYFSTTPPGDPPDVTQMTQLEMALTDGDLNNGVWAVDVPNPVANGGPGSSAQLYYVIVAQDNDDDAGTCDHVAQAPSTGSYAITVTNPGGSGGLSVCDSCTADVQCGASADLCFFMSGAFHCGTACDSASDCDAGYYCSFATFTSIDNGVGRQCIPNSYTCESSTPSCVDDVLEDNDTLSQAAPVSAGVYSDLKSCPATVGDDEDWFQIDLNADSTVTVSISGGSATDLDLSLTDANGLIIEKSDSLTSNESVQSCLPAGTYYAHVLAYDTGENTYTLDIGTSTGACGGSCSDDGNEDDDNAAQARPVDLNVGAYSSASQAICSMDDDWYEVELFSGETLHASLSFLQSDASEDLDIFVVDQNLNNLTGCSESTPMGCDPFNGQSGTSGETLAWPIISGGTYYVGVHGWNGAENAYDICIGLSAADCP